MLGGSSLGSYASALISHLCHHVQNGWK